MPAWRRKPGREHERERSDQGAISRRASNDEESGHSIWRATVVSRDKFPAHGRDLVLEAPEDSADIRNQIDNLDDRDLPISIARKVDIDAPRARRIRVDRSLGASTPAARCGKPDHEFLASKMLDVSRHVRAGQRLEKSREFGIDGRRCCRKGLQRGHRAAAEFEATPESLRNACPRRSLGLGHR